MQNNHLQIIEDLPMEKLESGKSKLCAQLSQTQKECLATALSLNDAAQLLIWQKQPEQNEDSEALAVLSPCELVSQWAERKNMLLLLPIFQKNECARQQLMQLACCHTLNTRQSDVLGLLTFCHTQPPAPAKEQGLPQFVQGWKYVLTVSFPIEEEDIWFLPLHEAALERCGGEVDLPQSLGKIWDCANTN